MFCFSAINGYTTATLQPSDSSEASSFYLDEKRKRHFTLTVETHNFPTGKIGALRVLFLRMGADSRYQHKLYKTGEYKRKLFKAWQCITFSYGITGVTH